MPNHKPPQKGTGNAGNEVEPKIAGTDHEAAAQHSKQLPRALCVHWANWQIGFSWALTGRAAPPLART